jgi:hypothetical protein
VLPFCSCSVIEGSFEFFLFEKAVQGLSMEAALCDSFQYRNYHATIAIWHCHDFVLQ